MIETGSVTLNIEMIPSRRIDTCNKPVTIFIVIKDLFFMEKKIYQFNQMTDKIVVNKKTNTTR
jgi:hypothetical protein